MAKKISYLQSKITDHREISPGYFRLSFFAPKIAQIAQPGQFVHIYCGEGTYLRRPFSIAGVKKNQVEIIYKVVGKGTGLLSQKKKGEVLDVIGPLGVGFSLSPIIHPPKQRSTPPKRLRRLDFCGGRAYHLSPIIVAGGTGVASLLFLAQKLHRFIVSSLITVLIGAKTKNDLLCVSDFKKLGCKVKIATEDGSLGFKGLVTDLFRRYLSTYLPRKEPEALLRGQPINLSTIYSCGSYNMLKEVAKIAQKNKIPCQVSLENIMACGIGACRGCAIKTQITADEKQPQITADEKQPQMTAEKKYSQISADKFKYKTVCKDGPVFEAKEIIWE